MAELGRRQVGAHEPIRPSVRPARAALLGLGLAFCLSPVLVDLAQHLAAQPWAVYILLFPPLLARCASREPPASASVGLGAVLLASGLALELVAVGGGVVRLGRLALPLTVIGLSRLFGLASLRSALLALWWVPVPKLLLSLPSPALETAWLQLAASTLNFFGTEIQIAPAVVRAGGAELALSSTWGGLPLAALLSGLGWYAAARRGEVLARCARDALIWGLIAFPLQIAALGLALVGLLGGLPGELLARLLQVLWIPCALAGLLVVRWRGMARGDRS